MNRRIGIGEFLGLLIDHVEERAGIECYDSPDNAASPFASVEIESTETANTKTMYVDVFNVIIHCISEPTAPFSSSPVLRVVNAVEEAMTEDVALPEPFELVTQEYTGLRSIKRDESGEGHAVLSYRFEICYGLICK